MNYAPAEYYVCTMKICNSDEHKAYISLLTERNPFFIARAINIVLLAEQKTLATESDNYFAPSGALQLDSYK